MKLRSSGIAYVVNRNNHMNTEEIIFVIEEVINNDGCYRGTWVVLENNGIEHGGLYPHFSSRTLSNHDTLVEDLKFFLTTEIFDCSTEEEKESLFFVIRKSEVVS